MSEKYSAGKDKEKAVEKGAKWYRNFNAAVGGIALVGAAIAPPIAAAGLGAYAGFNFLQAGAGEVVRRYTKNRSKGK